MKKFNEILAEVSPEVNITRLTTKELNKVGDKALDSKFVKYDDKKNESIYLMTYFDDNEGDYGVTKAFVKSNDRGKVSMDYAGSPSKIDIKSSKEASSLMKKMK